MLSLVEDVQAVNNTEAEYQNDDGEPSPDSPCWDGAYADGHRIRVLLLHRRWDSLSLK